MNLYEYQNSGIKTYQLPHTMKNMNLSSNQRGALSAHVRRSRTAKAAKTAGNDFSSAASNSLYASTILSMEIDLLNDDEESKRQLNDQQWVLQVRLKF